MDIRSDILCIDSTSIKVNLNAVGVQKTNVEQNIERSKGG